MSETREHEKGSNKVIGADPGKQERDKNLTLKNLNQNQNTEQKKTLKMWKKNS